MADAKHHGDGAHRGRIGTGPERAQTYAAVAAGVATTDTKTVSYERESGPRAPRPTPAEAFAHLPVQETVTLVPAEVQAEPAAFEQIGAERTFEVDVVPPKLFKREIVRPKFRRKDDRSQPPLIAPALARPIVGGYASAGLLAWVAIAKFVDHLPLARQEKMLARWGAAISRQTLCDWIARTAEWLEPLHRQMHRGLLRGDYVQCDETPVRCNDPDQKRGGTTQGWLWVLSRPGGEQQTLVGVEVAQLQAQRFAGAHASAGQKSDQRLVGEWMQEGTLRLHLASSSENPSQLRRGVEVRPDALDNPPQRTSYHLS